jgi:cytochrome c-type biogenesis protein CcmH/NrfF
MNLLWLAPVVVAVLGAVAVLPLVQRASREARGWGRDVERLSALRPALVELRNSAAEVQRNARAVRDR